MITGLSVNRCTAVPQGRTSRARQLPGRIGGASHDLGVRHREDVVDGLAVGKPRGRRPALTVSPVDRRTVKASSVNGASAPASKESNLPKPVPAVALSRTRNGHLGLNICPVPSLAQRGLVQAIVGRDALGHFGWRGPHPHSHGPP